MEKYVTTLSGVVFRNFLANDVGEGWGQGARPRGLDYVSMGAHSRGESRDGELPQGAWVGLG